MAAWSARARACDVALGESASSFLELILPRPCAGCGGEASPSVLCSSCRQHLREIPHPVVRPEPLPLPVWALGPYSTVRRNVIIAMKERGNHAVRGHLAAVYAAGLDWLRARGEIPERAILVPAPTRAASARARGGDPVAQICQGVARRLPGWTVVEALEISPHTADQSELDAAQRAANIRGSVQHTRGAAALRGHPVVLVDDVVTTGSTLRMSAAKLSGAGGVVRGALVLADA